VEYEDIDPNLRRAVESKDYPIEKVFRLKDADMNAKFQILQKNMEERCGKYSNQATAEFMLNLAIQKMEELEEAESDITEALP
jgi:hypothetical protein